jgi:hypothetical protein
MIRSRPKPKPRRAPFPLSSDRFDKFVAAMSWYVGRHKDRPEYLQAPAYFDAVSQWFDRLSLDGQERVHTAVYVYVTPGYGDEQAAVEYAAFLPDVPPPPAIVRRAWGHS